MLAKPDQDGRRHPLDEFVTDPTGIPPLCDEDEFAALMDGMVADSAPRLFAVVQEYGDRVDAECVGWGLAFDDHADVVGVGGDVHLGAPSLEAMLRGFRFGTHLRPRVVWVNPDAATPTD